MKMILLLLTAAFSVGSIQAFTHEDANQYIDIVLANRFQEEAHYSRLDPYKLEDIKIPLNHSKQPNSLATISRGELMHLSKVKRSKDCTMPFWQSANVTFTCFLSFNQLEIKYNASATFDGNNRKFNFYITVRGTNVTMQVTSNPQEDIPNMRVMFINTLGVINVNASPITGDNVTRIIGRQIRDVLITNTVRNLHHILNGRFKDALAYSIYKTPVGFAG